MSAHPSIDDADLKTFEDFWPYYLREHENPLNRTLHLVGTGTALGVFAVGAATLNPVMMGVAPLFAYGPAWVGHFIIEKNRPATFKYPRWSFRGDLRMFRLAVTRKLQAELDEAFSLAPASSAST
ncbi:MAG: hypothetical protein ACI9U2_001619 [Bradymonadia bacterium]|jgi:hypothetical protein